MLHHLKTKLLNSCATSARHLTQERTRFENDNSGVAAIEFALLAPIMIMMYFGLAEMAWAISQDRKISHAANVAGDLATQVSEIKSADLDEIMTATLKTIDVDDVNNITLEIASYRLDASGNPELVGKATLNGAGVGRLKPFDPSTLDARILNENSGVVVSRISYAFEPLKLRYFDSTLNLRENFLLKPRRSSEVLIGDSIGAEVNCTASTQNDATCGGAA